MDRKQYPGFIDAHVHLREPGATHKEDFRTGSRAAVKGGFTFVLDMPNNPQPTVSPERLEEKIARAQEKSLCAIGFHYGTNGRNIETFGRVWNHPKVFGLKIYCNHTTGEMLIEDHELLENVFRAWKSKKPILVHAEGPQLATTLALAKTYTRRLHVCHISQASEVVLVRNAKAIGQHVTAGVCPHHLFLTKDAVATLRGYAMMKPPLGTQEDQNELWRALNDGTIDIVETDHAPHTREEKEKDPPAFGVPGLETAVGLIGKGVIEKRIPESLFRVLLYDNPKKIFDIPDQQDTYIEIDHEKRYVVGEDGYETKCAWSPFDGWELMGKVVTVRYKGAVLMKDGTFVDHA